MSKFAVVESEYRLATFVRGQLPPKITRTSPSPITVETASHDHIEMSDVIPLHKTKPIRATKMAQITV